MKIFIAGMPGSGKSTVAKMLKRRRFKHIEISDTIKDLMRERGIEVTNKNIEEFALDMKARFGRDVFSKMLVERLQAMKGDVVISAVRSMDELNCFRNSIKNDKVFVIAVTAPSRMRFGRLNSRKVLKIASYKEFAWRDRKGLGMGLQKVLDSADYVLMNTGTSAQLKANLDMLMRILRKRASE